MISDLLSACYHPPRMQSPTSRNPQAGNLIKMWNSGFTPGETPRETPGENPGGIIRGSKSFKGFPRWKPPGKHLGKHGGKTPGKDPPGETPGETRGEIPAETFSGCKIIPLRKTPRKPLGISPSKGNPFLLCKNPRKHRGKAPCKNLYRLSPREILGKSPGETPTPP